MVAAHGVWENGFRPREDVGNVGGSWCTWWRWRLIGALALTVPNWRYSLIIEPYRI